jgi:aspartate aminotransferase-like enzyme
VESLVPSAAKIAAKIDKKALIDPASTGGAITVEVEPVHVDIVAYPKNA